MYSLRARPTLSRKIHWTYVKSDDNLCETTKVEFFVKIYFKCVYSLNFCTHFEHCSTNFILPLKKSCIMKPCKKVKYHSVLK